MQWMVNECAAELSRLLAEHPIMAKVKRKEQRFSIKVTDHGYAEQLPEINDGNKKQIIKEYIKPFADRIHAEMERRGIVKLFPLPGNRNPMNRHVFYSDDPHLRFITYYDPLGPDFIWNFDCYAPADKE